MRLGYLTNQYPSPTHTFIRGEILALEALGHEVRRYSIRRSLSELVDPRDADEASRTSTVLDAPRAVLRAALARAAGGPRRFAAAARAALRWGAPSRAHLAAYLAEAAFLVSQWQRDGVEQVHVHFGTNPTTVACLSRLLGGPPFSVTIHGDEPFQGPWVRGLRERLGMASAVIGISDGGVRRLGSWVAANRLHRVRCSLGPTFRTEFPQVPPEAGPVVFVGSLAEHKAPDQLVAAALSILEAGLVFDTWLLGDGPLRGRIEDMIRRSRFTERFQLHGWVSSEAVRAALVGSRCLVLPSRSEGIPVVAMEAFACARPVIATRVGSINELVEPGSSGWLVPPDDPIALRRALQQALNSPPARLMEMGLHGRTRTILNHDALREAERLESILARISC